LLDPHPAHNYRSDGTPLAFFSASTGAFGQMGELALIKTQNAMQDPDIVIPRGVDLTQVFYQHTDVTRASDLHDQLFNIWGEVPIAGVNQYYDVTSLTGSHPQVRLWYLENVVPTLKYATTPIPGVSPTSTPISPQPPAITGPSYEINVLSTVTDSSAIAANLESMMAAANSAYQGGHPVLGGIDLAAFIAYVKYESGKHITPAGATVLAQMGAELLAFMSA
jgi:hypothetical protein